MTKIIGNHSFYSLLFGQYDFLLIIFLLNARYSFAIEGDRRLYIMSETFKDILASFVPKTYAVLCQLRALQPHFLAVFFNDFFLDIFPTNILLNMIDSFLLEGVKILYRYGAAVICLYKSRIKSGSFTSADDFWSTVKREALLSATTMTHAQDGIKQDCRLLPDILGFAPKQLSLLSPTSEPSAKSNKLVFSVSVLKQRAFDMERGLGSKLMHPLNISRSYLQRKHQYYYMQFDNPKGRAEDDDRRDAVASSGGACRTESQAGLYNGDDNHNDSPPPSPIPVRTIFKLPSALLSSEQIAVLGAALPESSQWIRWVERYTANRDGWDLNHVFQLLNKKTPILLLFYLQAPYEDTVIGALHGDVIAPPNPTQIRGQGTINRVFVLNNGQLMCYPWVGLLQTQPGVFAPDAQISGNSATQHQFAVSSADFLTFGGSHEHFTNALRWEAANTGVIMTGHSDTYQNPPLMIPTGADSHQNSSYSFPIREVEIFSGP